jgi:hypothetical protein
VTSTPAMHPASRRLLLRRARLSAWYTALQPAPDRCARATHRTPPSQRTLPRALCGRARARSGSRCGESLRLHLLLTRMRASLALMHGRAPRMRSACGGPGSACGRVWARDKAVAWDFCMLFVLYTSDVMLSVMRCFSDAV